MASTELRLSSVKGEDGKSQVIVKLTISRSQRPCFKSGVFVSPKYFKPVRKTARGSVYGVVPPKKGKLNFVDMNDTADAKTALDTFVNRLLRICQVTEKKNKELLTKEWLENCIRVSSSINVEDITFDLLANTLENERKQQEEQIKLSEKPSFFELSRIYLQKKQFSYDRTKAFGVLFRDLARWEAYVRDKEGRDFSLDVDTITKNDIEDFRDYLANEKSLAESYPKFFDKILKVYPAELNTRKKSPELVDRGENTIKKLMKLFKAFFHWLNVNEKTNNRPFDGVEIGAEIYGTPYFLNLSERDVIARHDFSHNKALEVQRDIFIFHCMVGCRVGDLMRLTSNNVIDGFLMYMPNKTQKEKPIVARVPLLPYAKELLKKYEGLDKDGRLFPFISPQKYNIAIKAILTACGITRNVVVRNPTTGKDESRPINEIASSHMARRIFIGNTYEHVQDPAVIGKMSGHVEGSKAFARYRDVSDDVLINTLQNIDMK